MIKLYNKKTGAFLGKITEAHLRYLRDQLGEEATGNQDYHLNRDALDLLMLAGADANLVELFRKAFGDSEELEIRWSRD